MLLHVHGIVELIAGVSLIKKPEHFYKLQTNSLLEKCLLQQVGLAIAVIGLASLSLGSIVEDKVLMIRIYLIFLIYHLLFFGQAFYCSVNQKEGIVKEGSKFFHAGFFVCFTIQIIKLL